MNEVLNKIYSIDNIIVYIVVAIVVLSILFLIILLFGKKDQKLEETKRTMEIAVPNKTLNVKALLLDLESNSFLWTIADPIPVSEKLAKTATTADIAA